MKRTLYYFQNDDIKIDVTAFFEGSELVIEGYDIGPHVKELLGDSDYEYAMILPEKSVAELRNILNLNAFARKDLLETLVYKFNGENCFYDMSKYFDKHNIRYRTYSWA